MERPSTYALAGAGAAVGFARYYIQPELTAKRAWLTVAGFIVAHELGCQKGELMSEGADRLIDKHPIAARAAIMSLGVITTAHVANLFSDRRDPFKRTLDVCRRSS